MSAGRKNAPRLELDGSRGALAWDSEQPEELWLGHRERANEQLLRNPGLLEAEAQVRTTLPGGHAEGFAETFRELYRAVYSAVAEGEMPAEPDFPTFADGHLANVLGDVIIESNDEQRWVEVTTRLGLLTAALPQLSLAEVAGWAASAGFEMLEVACWPAATGPARRYAGVCHIDVDDLDADGVRQTIHARPRSRRWPTTRTTSRETTRRGGGERPSAQGDRRRGRARGRHRGHLRRADQTLPLPENLQRFRTVWPPLVEYRGARREDRHRELPMIFSWDEWPSGQNIALARGVGRDVRGHPLGELRPQPRSVASRLAANRLRAVVYDYASRIIHVHAKEIRRDGLYRHGTASLGMGWQVPRLPGLGEVRWDRFIAALYVGYDFVVSIEHEDRGFEATEDLVKRGFLLSRNVLRPLLV